MMAEILNQIHLSAKGDMILQLIVVAVAWDTIFGVIRAIKEHKFNSNFGIDGAIRKVSMIASLLFMMVVDIITNVNMLGFLPETVRGFFGAQVGLADFFAILYLSYETVSILKNMALCGLPVNAVWVKVKGFLAKYTDELPDND